MEVPHISEIDGFGKSDLDFNPGLVEANQFPMEGSDSISKAHGPSQGPRASSEATS